MAWAVSSGVLHHVEHKRTQPLTRMELVQALYQFTKMRGFETTQSTSLTAFADAQQLTKQEEAMVGWACRQKILKGTQQGRLQLQAQATRAQAAVMLSRWNSMQSK